jgi:hypothetical protein
MSQFNLNEKLRTIQQNPDFATPTNKAIVALANMLKSLLSVDPKKSMEFLCENPRIPALLQKEGIIGMTVDSIFYPLKDKNITATLKQTVDKKNYISLEYAIINDADEEEVVTIPTTLRASAKSPHVKTILALPSKGSEKKDAQELAKKTFFPEVFTGIEGIEEVVVKDLVEIKNSTIVDLGKYSAIVKKGCTKGTKLVLDGEQILLDGKDVIVKGGGQIYSKEFVLNEVFYLSDYQSAPSKDGKSFNNSAEINGIRCWVDLNLSKLVSSFDIEAGYIKCTKVGTNVSRTTGKEYPAYSFLPLSDYQPKLGDFMPEIKDNDDEILDEDLEEEVIEAEDSEDDSEADENEESDDDENEDDDEDDEESDFDDSEVDA